MNATDFELKLSIILRITPKIDILMSPKVFQVLGVFIIMPTAEEILQREIFRINVHLPRKRVPLSELLETEDPKIALRDGSEHHFRREELRYLASLVGEDVHNLKLPIILEISTLNRGYFRVRGKVEVRVIDEILGEYDPLNERGEALYPRYLLPRIRRLLPTTTTYAFISE